MQWGEPRAGDQRPGCWIFAWQLTLPVTLGSLKILICKMIPGVRPTYSESCHEMKVETEGEDRKGWASLCSYKRSTELILLYSNHSPTSWRENSQS